MTDRTPRVYALVLAVLVLFLTWAVVAARPWSASAASRPDPRFRALAQRELRLRHDAVLVRRVLDHRWRVYLVAVHKRRQAIVVAERRHHAQLLAAHAAAQAAAAAATAARQAAARSYAAPTYSSSSSAPAVRVVSLPPVVVTRSS